MKKNRLSLILFIFIFLGILSGVFGAWIFEKTLNGENEIIANFYNSENAVVVSPHGLRKEIAKGYNNYLLVDLRSQEEYDYEHIVGAVNVPAYRDKDNSDYGAVERITSSFNQLIQNNPDKEIVVYCYSQPCMTGRKVGKILAEHDIYVKHLGIGWNEWRYDWESWNHEHEWNNTNVNDYIVQGPDPGSYNGNKEIVGCSATGSLGC